MRSGLFVLMTMLSFGINHTASGYTYSSNGLSVSGYFNSDKFLDMAVVNKGYASISVLLGVGDGTFAAPVYYTTDANPQAIAAGDFDGDTKLDLVVAQANGSSSKLSILTGNGDGTFDAQVTFSSGTNPRSITVGDFDSDTKLDVALAIDANVSILMGNGNATFDSPVSYSTGAGHAGGIATGDFDGDTALDIAVVNTADSTVGILMGVGDGTFGSEVTYAAGNGVSTTGSIGLGDLNGDTYLDLAVVNSNDNTVSTLAGIGDGTFRKQIAFGVEDGGSSGGITIGDFNNDTYLDMGVVNPGSDSISILIGNGNMTFKSQIAYKTEAYPQAMMIGDMNGDGFLDLVAVSTSSSTTTFFGRGDGRFYR